MMVSLVGLENKETQAILVQLGQLVCLDRMETMVLMYVREMIV